ncbi:MAG: deoxyribonuclease IV [Oscillospiraceae bacterium]|nr:deoxyribonuclease IV [Oscillospiraceae bacterium]
MIIGSHVSMSGKDMFLNSVKEAISYESDTFMVYTGAPQNTRRKETAQLNIEAGRALMSEHGIRQFIVHAPYIINLANTVKPETFQLAVDFLSLELARTQAMGSHILILHPGSHVGAGPKEGIRQIVRGLNEVLTKDTPVYIALETMAGKGSEIGRSFEELAEIYDGVTYNEKLRVCFDTCHVNDAGYDIVHAFDQVMDSFDRLLGKEQIAVFHLNDSKNPRGAAKDRHENTGFGAIGFDALNAIAHHPDFQDIPKILESPYVTDPDDTRQKYPPYKYEIAMLRRQRFQPDLLSEIVKNRGL